MKDDQAKEEIKARYREQTGEELPDHVVENLGKLTGASLYDYKAVREWREHAHIDTYDEDDDTSAIEIVGAVLILTVTGLGALYLTQYIPSWPGKIVGGVLLWITLFLGIDLVSSAVNEVQE